jgi:hypothetical protein
MKDQPSKSSGTVPMTGAYIPQHKRMAAGEAVTGQTLPASGGKPSGPTSKPAK